MSSNTNLLRACVPANVRETAFFIAAVSALVLLGAWAFQWAGYQPCHLCLQERIPYYAAIPAGLLAGLLAAHFPRLALFILAAICCGFVYDAGLSIYHAGAEWKFWPGPDTCSGSMDLSAPIKLSQKLSHNTNIVRCDEAAIRILGISLAGYNALISVGLVAVGGRALFSRSP